MSQDLAEPAFERGQQENPSIVQSRASNYQEHIGSSRQYWRDIILGVNDGLVSTFLLVAGVAGSGLNVRDILLTAIAGALAGAVSMAAGEYLATKSQNEVMMGELKLEESHVENSLHRELEELDSLFPKIGITCENSAHVELHQTLKEFYRQHPRSLLNLMEALEFGFIEDEIRSPVIAGLFSCSLFVLGALPSILPFAFTRNTEDGLIAAAVATIVSVLAVGAFKTWATRGKLFVAALENLIITGLGGAMAYGVGILFDMLIK